MELIGAVLAVLGAVFVFIAAIGLHRFDDVFARTHAAGKATTFGLGLILLGAVFRLGEIDAAFKLALVGVLTLITVPAGAHLIARAAFRSGTELAAHTKLDDRSARRFRQS
ncbi:MAG: monovalent cation/H(+) antiporter subunit G [Acidimicrobiales bacterium]|jgi:multicomponent Na+:H+ antiporter subunit G|nr:monovalent cation/H(+) antiporter subunit G [Acidimicrobiales bacterium]